jgi:hypothetical protein
MDSRFSYQGALAASEKVNWRVEEIIGGDRRLDFDRPFLPDSLARVAALDFLTAREKLFLNQIRGHAYLHIFGLVEEFVLPFVLDHARPRLNGDDYRVRALLRFAGEEAKHIQLFTRFKEEFAAGFGVPCGVIGPAQEVARAVLAHHPLSVALTIAHIEWMTQRHYLDSVLTDNGLDPQFKSLLKHHWLEEAQHAKLDTLMIDALAEACSDAEIDAAFDGYSRIGALIDGGLLAQVDLDLESFERASGRKLQQDERQEFVRAGRQAARWTYLGSGMTHPEFLETVERLRPAARAGIEALGASLS